MNDVDRKTVLDSLDVIEDRIKREMLEQPEAEEIWIRMKEIEMAIRSQIKPLSMDLWQ